MPFLLADVAVDFTRPVVFGMMLFTGCITMCVLPMSCYHAKMACYNETTNEDIRETFRKKYDKKNPFDQGLKKNCGDFCFQGKSRILCPDFQDREEVEPNTW